MSKEQKIIELICEPFCSFYQGGKEELKCGTYDFLATHLTYRELTRAVNGSQGLKPDLSCDTDIKGLICDHCDFRVDGCDYRDGVQSPPCGGYTVVERLLKRNKTSS